MGTSGHLGVTHHPTSPAGPRSRAAPWAAPGTTDRKAGRRVGRGTMQAAAAAGLEQRALAACGHAGCAVCVSEGTGGLGQLLFSLQENPMQERQGEEKQNRGRLCSVVSTQNHRILTLCFLPIRPTRLWDRTRQRLLARGDFVPRKGHSLAPVRGRGTKSPALP